MLTLNIHVKLIKLKLKINLTFKYLNQIKPTGGISIEFNEIKQHV